jgi:hypothetical protein
LKTSRAEISPALLVFLKRLPFVKFRPFRGLKQYILYEEMKKLSLCPATDHPGK